jgi:hypothetical protein
MVVGVQKAIESALDGVSTAGEIASMVTTTSSNPRGITKSLERMDTRDPLKVDCPKCGAKAGRLCSTHGTICSLHEERKRRRTQRRGIRKVSVLATVRA